MTEAPRIAVYASDPMAFFEDLILPSGRGPVRFGDVMAPFQRERFARLCPDLLAIARGREPPIGRHFWESTKGTSKGTDMSAALVWLLAFTTRPRGGQIAAADQDQAD